MAVPLGRDVILLPGGVMPAELAYRDLLPLVSPGARALAKELEIYSTPEPPAKYGLDLEVAGILRVADEAGFGRFHLVGYSAGGASCLAFTAAHPDRLLSLALSEPAWDGVIDGSDEEIALWNEFRSIGERPPEQRMSAFVRAQLRNGVQAPPPPPGPPPPWMDKRPAGLAALIRTFLDTRLDPARLRSFDRPVYFAVGGLSNPDYYARMSKRLAGLFSDLTIDLYPDRHHFDPPHRAEPERFAEALKNFWARAESLR
ncbi:MAG: alpha/beta fold hydrolase [Candidatus Dormibacteria bacterium]